MYTTYSSCTTLLKYEGQSFARSLRAYPFCMAGPEIIAIAHLCIGVCGIVFPRNRFPKNKELLFELSLHPTWKSTFRRWSSVTPNKQLTGLQKHLTSLTSAPLDKEYVRLRCGSIHRNADDSTIPLAVGQSYFTSPVTI